MITPVSFNTINPNNRKQLNLARSMSKITFCARAEYESLPNIYFDPLMSTFFRRGVYPVQSIMFKDVIKAINKIYSQTLKSKILMVGLGRGEEPLSFLAVIKDKFQDKPLESVVEMNCVDLQPQIHDETLMEDAHLPIFAKPKFAKNSFDINCISGSYYVKNDIINYLLNIFKDTQKTKWDTQIQEFGAICPKETYNLISMNNVLLYITNEEAKVNTMEKVSQMLKPKGILVTDMNKDYKNRFKCLQNFKKLAPGIWQKLK